MTRRPSRVLGSYLLLQVPDLLLAGLVLWLLYEWRGLPPKWAIVLFVLWLVKDLSMYPLLRDVFVPSRTGPEGLIGARAIVRTALAPVGQVQLHGELWRGEALNAPTALMPGTAVIVRATRGLTLLVEAEEPRTETEARGRMDL
jgi:membrane protein implicated in regulation of membrane protease activity